MEAAQPAKAANKWALLIGINRYPYLAPRYQLDGCVNDVEALQELLVGRFGFSQEAPFFTVLKEEQATRDHILQAMAALVEQVGSDDIVVFFFAGHGSQVLLRDSSAYIQAYQSLVPYDSARPDVLSGERANQDILDVEVHDWLLRLAERTPFITLLFDCCHSATAHRDPLDLQPSTKSRRLTPGTLNAQDHASLRVTAPRRDIVRGPSGWLPLSERYTVLAACRDEETAGECRLGSDSSGTSMSNGAFTFYLCRALWTAAPGATYRDIYQALSNDMALRHPLQHPQCEGARDREIFGTATRNMDRYVTVFDPPCGAAQKILTLAAGSAHGIVPGSMFEIYDRERSGSLSPLARVRVTVVEPLQAEAVIEDLRAPIVTPALALEVARPDAARRTVAVIAPAQYASALALLRQCCENSLELSLVEQAQHAAIRIQLIDREANLSADLAAAEICEPSWIAVDLDGKHCVPSRRLAHAELLVADLERLARFDRILQLEAPPGSLDSRVSMQLVRAQPGPLRASGGVLRCVEDEAIVLTLESQADRPLFVTLLCLGMDRSISQLFPPPGGTDLLPASGQLQIGARRGQEVSFYFPAGFPPVLQPGEKQPEMGVDHLKLFLTSEPAEFSLLLQEGTAGEEPPQPCALENAKRSIRMKQRAPAVDWTTLTLKLEVWRNSAA
jgi:hypothetical protein